MDSATQDLLLMKLEELIIDEDKIMTVISASDLLNISAQDASKLLQVFAEDQKQAQKSVVATYILSGVLKDGSLGVRLLKQDELPQKTQLFQEVSSEILYSLQKCPKIDVTTIISINGFDSSALRENPVSGSLLGENCVKREIKVKRLPKPESKPVIKGKSSFFTKSASTGSVDKKEDSESSKSENKGAGKGISGFFQKSSSSENASCKRNILESPKTDTKPISKSKSNGGIASFFNKLPSKSVLTEKAPSDSQKNSEETYESEKEDALNGIEEAFAEEAMEVVDCKSSPVENVDEKSEETKTPETRGKKNKRQRSASKKSEKSSKRRKRIKEIQSDSDSDDMFADSNEEKNEDIIENSDDDQPVIKNKITTPPPVKNKRRKLVDKTYEDEEGFIITSKEWVYESASEDEKEQKDPAGDNKSEDSKSTQTAAVKRKKESSPPVSTGGKGKKGKKNGTANQPTLMSFFKKS